MAAHLTQVSSAHWSQHAEQLRSDGFVRRDVHGAGAEGGQQQTGGALWTGRSAGTQRLLPVRPVLPVPAATLSHAFSSASPPACPGRVHYKERLVELINGLGCDPALLMSPAEMRAELQRWNQDVPARGPEEAEPQYEHRLRLVSHHTHTHTTSQGWVSPPLQISAMCQTDAFTFRSR